MNEVTASQLQGFHVRNPEVRIIALLDFAHPQDERRVKQHGVDAIVPKLTSATQLLGIIRELGPQSFSKLGPKGG